MKGLTIERVLSLSTGHITADTAAALTLLGAEEDNRAQHPDLSDLLSVMAWDYGWLIWADSSFAHATRFPELVKLIRVALDHGCTWIRFDCDGPEVEALDRFTWTGKDLDAALAKYKEVQP